MRRLRLHIFTLVVLSAPSLSQVSFDKPDFDTGKHPVWVEAADFNGDGIPDFVTANSDDNSISLLLGRPDGTLRSRIDYHAGAKPVALAVGDWNNDGLADVAVANFDDNTVSIFVGNGRGRLRFLESISVGNGPIGLVAKDFNGDGIPDLVVANRIGSSCGNNAAIFLGDGEGGFSFTSMLNTGVDIPVSIATGDFDRDGNYDVAVWAYSCDHQCNSTVYLFAGRGNGEFDPPTMPSRTYGTAVRGQMITTDLNNDGVLDLVFVNVFQFLGSGQFALIGKGDGTFSNPMWLATGRAPISVVAADVNGDGLTDLAIVNSADDTISVLYGKGNGEMTYRLRYVTGLPDEIVANDFNGDGLVDLAVASSDFQKIWVFPGNGDGSFGTPKEIVTGHPTRSMVSADFNRDGIPDLAILISDPAAGRINVNVYLGNGDGTFAQPITYLGDGGTSMVVADFNQDGILDLAISNERNNTVSLLLGNGDGSFQQPIASPVGRWPVALGVGDFDGDGIPDLAVAHLSDTRLFILLGNGDGTFHPGPIYNFARNVSQIAVDDLNHDGALDLVIGYDHQIAVFLGDGSGGFQRVADYPTPFPGAFGPYGVRTADINGDGIPDIVTANSVVSVWLGNGDGTFGSRMDFSSGGAYRNVITDFDNDGKPDIAVTNYNDTGAGPINILLNRTVR